MMQQTNDKQKQQEAAKDNKITITDLTHDMRGVGRLHGKAIFVEQALPGEIVTVNIIKKRRGYNHAQLIDIEKKSEVRQVPSCAHYGTCGGCLTQHIDINHSFAFKKQRLLQKLYDKNIVAHMQLADVRANSYNYRRRARLSVKYVIKKERVLVGFREKGTSYVADLQSCKILCHPFDELLLPLADLIAATSLKKACPQIEITAADKQNALVLRILSTPTADDIDKIKDFALHYQLSIYLQSGGIDTCEPLILVDKDTGTELDHKQLLYSDVDCTFAGANKKFRYFFEPLDFIQINKDINQQLVNLVVNNVKENAHQVIVDLFCGSGNFTLPLAVISNKIIGIEADHGLLAKAQHNAQYNAHHLQAQDIQFKHADLYKDNLTFLDDITNIDCVVLDPPRSGAWQVLSYLFANKISVKKIVYISCNMDTLVRDAELIVKNGFYLDKCAAVDMFPQTAHLETLAIFKLIE